MRTTVPCVRTLVLICAFSLSGFFSFSQSITSGNGKYEIGLGFGPLFFLGDLGGNHGTGKTFLKDVNLPLTRIAKGIYANVYPAEWIGFRVAVNQGKLEGYDSQVQDKGGAEYHRKLRNLEFESPLLEAYVATEIYPTVFMEKYDGLQGKFRPYGLAGIGMFRFNPKARFYENDGTSRMVALQPLRLEGQGMEEYPSRKQYSLTAMEIPMGFGAKYFIRENMYVGFEVLHRKTFTDYIDNVSTNYIDAIYFDKYLTPEDARMARQLHFRENFVPNGANVRNPPLLNEQRGDPKENDSYFSTLLRFGWRLNDWNSPNGRAMRQLRCPAYY